MDADTRSIKIHTAADFIAMRIAGRLAADTLDFIAQYVVPGAVTGELDHRCAEYIASRGGGLGSFELPRLSKICLYFC